MIVNKIKAKVASPEILESLLTQIENNLKPMELNGAVFYIDKEIYNAFPFNVRFIEFTNKPEMSLILEPIPARSLGEYIEVYSKNLIEIEIYLNIHISEDNQKFYKSVFMQYDVDVSFIMPKNTSPMSDIVDTVMKEYINIVEICISNLDFKNTSKEEILNILNTKKDDLKKLMSFKELTEYNKSIFAIESYKRKIFNKLNLSLKSNNSSISLGQLKHVMDSIEREMRE